METAILSSMKIGVLLYTYNRTDDARINMEIIRRVWCTSEILKGVTIVHAYNGEKGWWPEKYLEDELLVLQNPGHFAGAEILIDEGMKAFQVKYPDVDYVILLAADTWLVDPEYVERTILSLKKEGKYLATCTWGTRKSTDMWKVGCAMDFAIFDLKWITSSGLFPIGFTEFRHKYEDLFHYNDQTIYLERVFMLRVKQAIARTVKLPSDNMLKRVAESYIHRMVEREPVHVNGKENLIFKSTGFHRTMYWPDIGLLTHHEPLDKQQALMKWNIPLGEHGTKFLTAEDLNYFNRGLSKHEFVKNDKKIGYGD